MKTNTLPTHNQRKAGMTLVELLAAMAIVGVLSGLLFATVGSMRDSAYTTEKVSGARNMINAFLLTPQDNRGNFMMGYGDSGRAVEINGRRSSSRGEEAKRFPWRLAPYMDDNIAALYMGDHAEFYDKIAGNSPYTASLYPTFGINSIFVGGHYDGRSYAPDFEPSRRSRGEVTKFPRDFWVLRPADAYDPGKMIVFISALATTNDYEGPVGYFRVSPPSYPSGTSWGSYNPDIPASMGHVSLEHDGRAVVAQLDGSVSLLSEEELRDMRRWSNQAAKYNEPNFSQWDRAH